MILIIFIGSLYKMIWINASSIMAEMAHDFPFN